MSAQQFIMVVRVLLSVILTCVMTGSVFAGIGEWKSYTDMKSVRSIATDGTVLWAGTSGGIFRFDPADSSYQKFTNAEGLTTNDVTAIVVDSYGNVWVGQQNGFIDIYSPQRGTWRYVSNIADDKTKTSRAIRSFYQNGDRMYIATSFGLTVFSISKLEFEDTHLGFSSIIQPNVAAAIVFQNRIFVATSGGIAATTTGATNLTDPKSWEILSSVKTGNRFALFNGELYVSTESGMLKFQSNSFSVTNALTNAVRIISVLDTALIFSDGQFIRSLNTTTVSPISGLLPSGIVGGAITSDRRVYVGFPNEGIGSYQSGTGVWDYLYPNGPNSNLFYSIVVDENNTLWSVSGRSNGKGFYCFDGMQWKNYNTSNTPMLLSNDCFAIGLGPDNTKWIGTWGEGLVVVNGNGNVVRRFDYDDPGFIGVIRNANEGIPSYTVPGKIAVDTKGAVWVTVFASVDRTKVLWKMNPDGTWESFAGSPFGQPSFMYNIIIDQNNTKWFTNRVPGGPDNTTLIVFYNESKNFMVGRTDGWGTITIDDGATNLAVHSAVVDKSGDLWIGTGSGVTIITDSNNPINRVSKVFLGAVRDQVVQCIEVDALNNKWLGTREGVFILSPDGTQLLNHFSVENTGGKLVDNNILSIAFDKNRGIAYFGTEKGLSSLEITPVAAKTSMSTIDLSPNPVYLPTHGAVEIRGLVEESTIKVLSIYGKVLKQFPAQGGGRAFWDCTDGEGNSVATGIYIIVAHDRNGTQVASAKVAVIRK
ncbi:MAG: two-component regulator propeller domain-containing protein [Bacteroidota bacterium]